MSTNKQQHNLVDQENCQLSSSVHPRDEEAKNSSPEARRPRLLRGSGEAADYDHPQVLCFAAQNRRGRFYIPCRNNIFGGITVENVLLDSGYAALFCCHFH